MNNWFYRTAGAVGVASGVVLLSGGFSQAAHATETLPAADLQSLVSDYFTPTGGLRGMGLSVNTEAASRTENLPLVGDLPLVGGLAGGDALGRLPVVGGLAGSGPLGGLLGGDQGGGPASGPASDGGPLGLLGKAPVGDGLVGDTDTPISPDQRSALDGIGATAVPADIDRQLATPAMDAAALPSGITSVNFTRPGESGAEALPLVGSLPVVGGLSGGNPTDELPLVSGAAQDLPLVGNALDKDSRGSLPTIGTLPLVHQLPLIGGLLPSSTTDDQRPMVADVPGDDRAVDDGLGQDRRATPAPVAQTLPAVISQPAGRHATADAEQPVTRVGKHRATDRPVAGDDTEYLESSRVEDLPPILSGISTTGGLSAVPGGSPLKVTGLTRQLPLVGMLPMQEVRQLPLVGMLPIN